MSVSQGLTSPGTDDTRTREGRKLEAALMIGDSTMETCFFSVILSFEEDLRKYSRKKNNKRVQQSSHRQCFPGIGCNSSPTCLSHKQKVSGECVRTRLGSSKDEQRVYTWRQVLELRETPLFS